MVERILYGVQGEGRGHASRSLQIIQWLMTRGYRVKVLTGGDALRVFEGMGLDLEEVPMLRYRFRSDGAFSPRRTVLENAPRALGLFFGMGKQLAGVRAIVDSFKPQLIISDFEPYLSRIAKGTKVPLLAIDHQHFLTESILPRISGLQKFLMLKLFQLGTSIMAGRPDRIITSSFYHFPKKRASRAVFVGPFISNRLKQRRMEVETDDSVTVYLKQPVYLSGLLRILAAHPETRFVVFSDWRSGPPRGLPANVHPAPIGREEFLDQLARGKALITTAGNQVIGEAIYLNKPVLAFPEPEVLEQELNALALQFSGFGNTFHLRDFTLRHWDAFEEQLPQYRDRIENFFRTRRTFDGRREAVRALRNYLQEISAPAGRKRKTQARSRARLSLAG